MAVKKIILGKKCAFFHFLKVIKMLLNVYFFSKIVLMMHNT